MTVLLNKMDSLLVAQLIFECEKYLVTGERVTSAGRLDAGKERRVLASQCCLLSGLQAISLCEFPTRLVPETFGTLRPPALAHRFVVPRIELVCVRTITAHAQKRPFERTVQKILNDRISYEQQTVELVLPAYDVLINTACDDIDETESMHEPMALAPFLDEKRNLP